MVYELRQRDGIMALSFVAELENGMVMAQFYFLAGQNTIRSLALKKRHFMKYQIQRGLIVLLLWLWN